MSLLTHPWPTRRHRPALDVPLTVPGLTVADGRLLIAALGDRIRLSAEAADEHDDLQARADHLCVWVACTDLMARITAGIEREPA